MFGDHGRGPEAARDGWAVMARTFKTISFPYDLPGPGGCAELVVEAEVSSGWAHLESGGRGHVREAELLEVRDRESGASVELTRAQMVEVERAALAWEVP